MSAFRTRVNVSTRQGVEVLNITRMVGDALRGSSIQDGIACVSIPHTTCALTINEDEPGLRQDLERLAEGLLDPLKAVARFRHDAVDDNAQAHLTSTLFGPSLVVPFSGGAPVLGTWQSILLVEMDGPRTRHVDLTVVG